MANLIWKCLEIHYIPLNTKADKKNNKKFCSVSQMIIFAPPIKVLITITAEVAHLVERDLAKVEVAGSSPVFRSESR